ncbi:hypothetical protein NRY95_05685 [Xanthomonas campestris pv. phormiicola]|nr:hypothetical protein [Xanthomonas campestris pv. phormiicola]UYC17453.1 hypothetical protein NRY95_05685 [Xanthomonas campestris pv. phormiicola]
MSNVPLIAVIVDGTLVKDIIIENWPINVAPPRIAVGDVATRFTHTDDLFQIPVGDAVFEASGYEIVPKPYHPGRRVVSPKALIDTLRRMDVAAVVTQARYTARKYGFVLNDRNARLALNASARRLFITLDEQELTEALNELMQEAS